MRCALAELGGAPGGALGQPGAPSFALPGLAEIDTLLYGLDAAAAGRVHIVAPEALREGVQMVSLSQLYHGLPNCESFAQPGATVEFFLRNDLRA